jgi:hypothetical protein
MRRVGTEAAPNFQKVLKRIADEPPQPAVRQSAAAQKARAKQLPKTASGSIGRASLVKPRI